MPEASSVEEFMWLILSRKTNPNEVVSYRGITDQSYSLTPSIFRSERNKEQEHVLLRELLAAHPKEFDADKTSLERLVRMQHYELPTRLLDVSFNPLVALYFASQVDRKRKPVMVSGKRLVRTRSMDGQVVVLTISRSKVKYFDSDTVSILSNLSQLSCDLKNKIDTTRSGDEFNHSLPIRRLLHFIRQENYEFEAGIIPSDLNRVLLVKPKLNNNRIITQNGAFFIFGMNESIDESGRSEIKSERITIPSAHKARIRGELDKLNLNEKTMFPEIDRAARYFAQAVQNQIVTTILTKP